MKTKYLLACLLLAGMAVVAARALTESPPAQLDIAQAPLFTHSALPPLNMLVMGRDHKLYYEAYNDASDLDGDGVLDVGYKGWVLKIGPVAGNESRYKIDYYGYFNSYVCYEQSGDRFVPKSSTADKTCGGTRWSGDFLNYLTTSRMDALRRVLYGGYRNVDTPTETVLQASFTPQDAHSWGKEYQSLARDGYSISSYAPLNAPGTGRYHLFAVTTLSDNGVPQLRVLNNTTFRIWNWVSIEQPVAGSQCSTDNSTKVDCVTGSAASADWVIVPDSAYRGLTITTWRDNVGTSNNAAQMDTLFANNNNLCGSGPIAGINTSGSNNNPFPNSGACTNRQDNYHTLIQGSINIPTAGTYQFAVNGDDAIEVAIDGKVVYGWYGDHGGDTSAAGLTSHSGSVALSAGPHSVRVRHEENTQDDYWQLYWKPPPAGGSTAMTNYPLRVLTCPSDSASAGLRDANCKAYGNTSFKPTGILHDYGESDRMYFGLLTGSYQRHTEGGVLRKNMSSFKDEVNPATGQFTGVNGIVRTIDTFRTVGFNYNSHAYDAPGCGWITNRAMVDSDTCYMWGNPVAEMMYETLRYFGGATAPKVAFDYGTANTPDSALGLAKPAWKPPYAATSDNGGGYPMCSQPTMTVLSDINPSYDFNVPGSKWASVSRSDDPASLARLDASAQADAIWTAEGGGTRRVFIGESNNVADNAPTPKDVSNLSTVRGLSPEEPSKQGTYYSASMARYGATTAIGGDKHVRTYSIALASPLPKFEFPVGNGRITLVPFAKSVYGPAPNYPIDPASNFQPTDQIVDFYVQKVANTSGINGADYDRNVNGGRPHAEFRINYEDVEQGADHDMDAIVLYTLDVNSAGQLVVTLNSEYAAGGIDQYIGYVISGTTRDGVYLEVRDRDASMRTYRLNTPPNRAPGYCAGGAPPADCNGLPLDATRTFDVGATAGAGLLENPLWYAAKYGTDQGWDVDNDGVPDNYFLVTNPLYLSSQLSKAFDSIQKQDGASGSVAVSGAQVDASSFVVMPSYGTSNNGTDWVGDLSAYPVLPSGQIGSRTWSASARMPTTAAGIDARNIFTSLAPVDGANPAQRAASVVPFVATALGADDAARFGRLGLTTTGQVSNQFGSVSAANLVNYLRGYRDMEGTALNSKPFRIRTGVLGDIINSTPVIATKRANYGWAAASGLDEALRTSYTAYVNAKAGTGNREHVYIGANDGMLHGFNDAGDEEFAYIPNAVLGNMALLAQNRNGGFQHRYYVDGALALGDVPVNRTWKTLLAGGMGAGGKGVFGLDVTTPGSFTKSDVLWERNGTGDDDMGYVMGKPVIVPLDNGQWVALFGNGYNSVNGKPVLYVVDVATGALLAKLQPSNSGDTIAGQMNGLGNLAVVDTNRDGLVDTVYGGDLHGAVWKFNVGTAKADDFSVALGGAPLFVATDPDGKPQPITGGFEVTVGANGRFMLYFGTGRYFTAGDNSTKDAQSVYGILDSGTPIASGRAALAVQQITSDVSTAPPTRSVSSNRVNYQSQRGWYMDLRVGNGAPTGERMIGNPRIQSGKVYFPTYIPGVSTDCRPGGTNWLYGLNALTGAAGLGNVSVPPNSSPIGGGSTGGVSTGTGSDGVGAPSRGVGVLMPRSVLPAYCDPAVAGCNPEPPINTCSEVVVDPINSAKSLSVQRACGRQSWRQLR